MKSTLILLLLLVGCAAAWRRSGRGRRNGADPDVTAINCITSQCAMVAMPLMQHYQMLFQSWGPTAIRQMVVNITTDEAQLAKLCTDYNTLLACPAEKCTLTDDLRAIIEAMNWLDYPCKNQAEVRDNARCIAGVYTEDRMKEEFAEGTPCRTSVEKFHEKYAAIKGHARGYVSRFPAGGSASSLRRRRQLIPQVTENPFPELKRRLAEQFSQQAEAPTCEETLTMLDCLLKPVKDDCEDGAETLIMETMKDMHVKQEKFVKAFVPQAEGKYPDIAKCLTEREGAAAAFFKLFF